MSAIITCEHLNKDYGNKKILKDVNVTIEKGRIIGLLGPNGSGKTTLIKLINGLLVPTSGNVLVLGSKPGVESKKIISYLPERTYLPDNETIEQIIQYFSDFYFNFHVEKAYELLEKLKINPKDKLKTLSKGNKEKVQLALVMSRDADVYILDEPIGGVDPVARDYILSLILDNFKEEATLIISTHLIADIEKILDEVIFIHEGKIVLQSSADELRMQYKGSIENAFKEVFKNV